MNVNSVLENPDFNYSKLQTGTVNATGENTAQAVTDETIGFKVDMSKEPTTQLSQANANIIASKIQKLYSRESKKRNAMANFLESRLGYYGYMYSSGVAVRIPDETGDEENKPVVTTVNTASGGVSQQIGAGSQRREMTDEEREAYNTAILMEMPETIKPYVQKVLEDKLEYDKFNEFWLKYKYPAPEGQKDAPLKSNPAYLNLLKIWATMFYHKTDPIKFRIQPIDYLLMAEKVTTTEQIIDLGKKMGRKIDTDEERTNYLREIDTLKQNFKDRIFEKFPYWPISVKEMLIKYKVPYQQGAMDGYTARMARNEQLYADGGFNFADEPWPLTHRLMFVGGVVVLGIIAYKAGWLNFMKDELKEITRKK